MAEEFSLPPVPELPAVPANPLAIVKPNLAALAASSVSCSGLDLPDPLGDASKALNKQLAAFTATATGLATAGAGIVTGLVSTLKASADGVLALAKDALGKIPIPEIPLSVRIGIVMAKAAASAASAVGDQAKDAAEKAAREGFDELKKKFPAFEGASLFDKMKLPGFDLCDAVPEQTIIDGVAVPVAAVALAPTKPAEVPPQPPTNPTVFAEHAADSTKKKPASLDRLLKLREDRQRTGEEAIALIKKLPDPNGPIRQAMIDTALAKKKLYESRDAYVKSGNSDVNLASNIETGIGTYDTHRRSVFEFFRISIDARGAVLKKAIEYYTVTLEYHLEGVGLRRIDTSNDKSMTLDQRIGENELSDFLVLTFTTTYDKDVAKMTAPFPEAAWDPPANFDGTEPWVYDRNLLPVGSMLAKRDGDMRMLALMKSVYGDFSF